MELGLGLGSGEERAVEALLAEDGGLFAEALEGEKSSLRHIVWRDLKHFGNAAGIWGGGDAC